MTAAECPARTLRIGTRSSPLALARTEVVIAALREQVPDLVTETVPVATEADSWQDDLAQPGGKGLCTKQIDAVPQAGTVDMTVHCVKDAPGDVPPPEGNRAPDGATAQHGPSRPRAPDRAPRRCSRPPGRAPQLSRAARPSAMRWRPNSKRVSMSGSVRSSARATRLG
ncbi:hypothetical protein ACFY00_01060 [Kitasatospora sp. NPDC001540]|uniref:hypothetical protein n=1 Tax=Kitasatospora sp. NPDC001540 TaxID=3364014 RepID=UPI00369B8B4F